MSPEQEGVIKFHYSLQEKEPRFDFSFIQRLNEWRNFLYAQKLIGQDPEKYEGKAYGNVSQKVEDKDRLFIITASQTGGIVELIPEEHYTLVTSCDLATNYVGARGVLPPSSEAMTHAAVYACGLEIKAVFHVHCPGIWQRAAVLGIPVTRPGVEYGTPAMAEEVKRLFRETEVKAKGIFSTGGHEDGIITFGRTVQEAGDILRQYLAQSSHTK